MLYFSFISCVRAALNIARPRKHTHTQWKTLPIFANATICYILFPFLVHTMMIRCLWVVSFFWCCDCLWNGTALVNSTLPLQRRNLHTSPVRLSFANARPTVLTCWPRTPHGEAIYFTSLSLEREPRVWVHWNLTWRCWKPFRQFFCVTVYAIWRLA